MSIRSVAAIVVAAVASAMAAQEIHEQIEVSIVNVDAVVTDRKGNHIHGLTRDDFEVLDDGVPQPITNFTEIRGATPAPQPATPTTTSAAPQPAPQVARQPRTVIVFVERFFLPQFRIDPVFASLKKTLHETIRPGDRALVVTWNRGVLLTRQDYTDDLAKLDAAIDEVAKRTSAVIADPVNDVRQDLDMIDEFETKVLGRANGAPPSDTDEEDFLKAALQRMNGVKAKRELQEKVKTINALMRSISGREGRKILILATHRLSQFAGAEYYFLGGAKSVPITVRAELDTTVIMRSLIETANENGVTIYPTYPEGIGTYAGPTAAFPKALQNASYDSLVLANETPTLHDVAVATGGAAAWGSEDVSKLLPHLADDLDSYYSLAYRAPKNDAGKPHNIVVKVKDRSLNVRARREYALKSDNTKMEDRVIASLFNQPTTSAFFLDVTANRPTRTPNKHLIFPVNVSVPISSLTLIPGANGYDGSFSVYVAWGSRLGGASDAKHETRKFTIPTKDLEKAKQDHFTFTFGVESETSDVTIAIGVVDDLSKEYSVRRVQLKAPQ